ncbi:nijmegen breakage syndrome 1 protein isoform X2 [Phalaenopsis equestris]|uniref:nijmegen breakage syndrome 1 protein isoform X2 n=1 Tax=Phalaenopsis equestris TaxID=78828 RepID=UPI0009E5A4A1|nr:nijmegen breakage syndrome 1 protein isoform X2 [Phalaenopsis equestris]
MVWGLIPAEALRGAQKYYILAPGTYKVGRKDCDIVVQMDPAVSRLHAEIIVDKLISPDSFSAGPTNSNSHVRIRDCSKYGTFVNKEVGSKAGRLRQGEEATLKEGETATFGTGNASFRFCFIPLTVFIHNPKRGQLKSIQAIASSIGATITPNWRAECTHVLVNESSSVSIELIDSILAKQFVVLVHWFEVVAEKNICTELPSCSAYVPTLKLEDNIVRIVDPKVQENCLEGYEFVLTSPHKYKFGDKLLQLLKMIGARFVGANEFLLDSQTSAAKENNQAVLVIPGESANEVSYSREFSSLSRITDVKLLAAILSGNLDSSFIELPSIVISSSHSTDETIVADSDVEADTAATNIKSETFKENHTVKETSSEKYEDEEQVKDGDIEEKANSTPIEGGAILIRKINKNDVSDIDRHENSDILYSPDLIVRNAVTPVESVSSEASSVNFKRFRQEINSGNSFRALIPFSKDPYKEGDYGREESDYMREERKRKKMEAIAEEMFNSEKLKKRAAAGTSLEAFLARC